MFPLSYSKANCILECAWKEAAEDCGCVPWYLKRNFADSRMCELLGNACFKRMVGDRERSLRDRCEDKCPRDCETTEFEIKMEER